MFDFGYEIPLFIQFYDFILISKHVTFHSDMIHHIEKGMFSQDNKTDDFRLKVLLGLLSQRKSFRHLNEIIECEV